MGTFLVTAIGISTLSWWVDFYPFTSREFPPPLSPQFEYDHEASAIVMIFIGLGLPVIGFIVAKMNSTAFESQKQIKDQGIVFIVGILFSIGLMVSGMSRR